MQLYSIISYSTILVSERPSSVLASTKRPRVTHEGDFDIIAEPQNYPGAELTEPIIQEDPEDV